MTEDIFHLGIKALIRDSEGKFLLLKVNPAKLRNFSGEPYWDIPGGRIQRGSTVEETLRREVEEETGITAISSIAPFKMVLSKIRIPINDSDVGLILGVYVCEVDAVQDIRLSDEHIEVGWFDPEEAWELLRVKYPEEFTEALKDFIV